MTDDRELIIAGMLARETPRQLAEALADRCGCAFDSRLPDDAPPYQECDYHHQRSIEAAATLRRVAQMEQELDSYKRVGAAAAKLLNENLDTITSLDRRADVAEQRAEAAEQTLARVQQELEPAIEWASNPEFECAEDATHPCCFGTANVDDREHDPRCPRNALVKVRALLRGEAP